jgi:nitrogen regulatory protein P-II 1
MKKIEAIIRKTKFEEVKDALYEAGIEFFSFWDVRGVGQAREGRVYRGIVYDTSTIERTKLSIIVRTRMWTRLYKPYWVQPKPERLEMVKFS